MKPPIFAKFPVFFGPAAFRRLCVETSFNIATNGNIFPAAFRRLCVETLSGLAGAYLL